MAYVQLAHAGEAGDRLDVEVVERMTRVEPHACGADRLARGANALQLGKHRRAFGIAPFRMERMRVGTGVDLADRSADPLGRFDLAQLCVDKHRDDDSGASELRHFIAQRRLLRADVEPALGRDLVPALGHQHRHLGLDAAGDGGHLVGRSHFQI